MANSVSLIQRLEAETSILGLRLYLVIAISAAFAFLALILIYLCIRMNRRSKWKMRKNKKSGLDHTVIMYKDTTSEIKTKERPICSDLDLQRESVVDVDVDHHPKVSITTSEEEEETSSRSVDSVDHHHLVGWDRWFSFKELERATSGFTEKNVIGEGGYGIVYRGILPDGSAVAVKYLLNNKKSRADKELEVEIEAIGKVRHKNLVGLLGYCAEGPSNRLLVYEYVDNGNLEQWLHGHLGPLSPLTWEIRMKIAIGTAKGLAYLHEGLEPKVVHRDVKSSNILLDRKWNAKVSDFGLAKLLEPEKSHVTTRVMGTFGYVSPEYASTGMLNEGSDVYSFGVLLMEIVTGRTPIDYSKPPGEMNLVDWFKGMLGNRRSEEVIDPLLELHPTPRALKRVLLVCLRCIDLDAAKRPKMSQILHMLETDHDFPFRI